jgi:hypothetical protein
MWLFGQFKPHGMNFVPEPSRSPSSQIVSLSPGRWQCGLPIASRVYWHRGTVTSLRSRTIHALAAPIRTLRTYLELGATVE